MIPENFLCRNLDRACFTLLFEIENFLRALLRWELRGRHPADWLGILPSKLVEEAKDRAAQEREIAYLDSRRSSILSYLNLSELKDVLLETAIWDTVFKYYWPPKEVVRAEFRKLLAIRNKSAHFRPVTKRDLRVASRFAEDLADWTRHYRKTRSAAVVVQADSNDTERFFEGVGQKDLGRLWSRAVDSGDAARFHVTIGAVSNHLAFTLLIPEASAQAEQFLACLERFESVLTFCRVGDLGDRFCLYLPRKAETGKICECFEAFLEGARHPGAGLSSDEARVQFQIAEWELIVPWGIEMPANFSFPAEEWLLGAAGP